MAAKVIKADDVTVTTIKYGINEDLDNDISRNLLAVDEMGFNDDEVEGAK